MSRIFLGRCEPIRVLGEGGMGRVYLARQHDLARQVVVKVMHDHLAADPDFRARFEQETLLLAKFEHPYAVRLYDAALDDPEGPCMVLEYVRGVTLEAMLKKNHGRIHAARIARLLEQLCDVLQAAHDLDIIHRDLKPANIMIVDADTPKEKIKVMDFGLAVLQNQANRNNAEGRFLGTPYYVSPEQARGEQLDQRSDLYSVGVMLYQMLAGQLPFVGQSTPDVLLAHVHEVPPTFAEIDAVGVPPAIEEVVRACLAKERSERPASAHDLFERYQHALTQAGDPTTHTDPEIATATATKPDLGEIVVDPDAVVYHMRATMSRAMAELKLRGFIQASQGEVVQSIPGLIRVRLGKSGTLYEFRTGLLSWLGLGQLNGMEVYLYLRPEDEKRPDVQHITVMMRSLDGHTNASPHWRAHCTLIYKDLRGYLMGQDIPVGT